MKVSSYKEMVDSIVRQGEIIELTELRKKLNKAKDSSRPTVERVNLLIDTLGLATSYHERLTQIKISLRRVEAQLQKSLADKRAEVMMEDDFSSSRRKADQTFLIERKCKPLLSMKEYLVARQESVQYAMDYVTAASFNIKSIMSILKEYFNAEGVS